MNNLELNNILMKYAEKKYNGTIILLANVYGKTTILSNDKLRLQAEFFNETEFDYILSAIKKSGYDVMCYFDENKFISDYLNNSIPTKEFLVFNLARNGYGIGKKSLIPTFCDLNNIKYTSSNGYACSLARHKYHVNILLKHLNLNYLESYVYDKYVWMNNNTPNNFSSKYIAKPLSESASQGISDNSVFFCKNKKELDIFIKNKYEELNCTPILLQQFIEGYEAKTTIIDFDKSYVFPPVGVEINGQRNLKNLIISEDIAFTYNHRNYLLDSELGSIITENIRKQALIIYKAIGLQNYGRIDCRIDNKTKEIYFIDFSTMPYFVSDGEMLFSFKSLGYDIENLINAIINSALISKYNYSL